MCIHALVRGPEEEEDRNRARAGAVLVAEAIDALRAMVTTRGE